MNSTANTSSLLATYETTTLEQLRHLATHIASAIPASTWIYLHGDLGTGKTTFAQFFIHAMGFQGRVKSPTYSLVEHYHTPHGPVMHMDLYRLTDPEELYFLGLDDWLQEDKPVALVEWPENGQGLLPPADLALHFSIQGQKRSVTVHGKHKVFSLS